MNADSISTQQKVWITLGLIAAAAAVSVLYGFDPARHAFFPPCPFFKMTGLYCPACGSTRALHELLHADFAQAFQCNPLLIVLLPWLVWTLLVMLVKGWTGRKWPLAFARWVWGKRLLAVVVVFGIVRNLPSPWGDGMHP